VSAGKDFAAFIGTALEAKGHAAQEALDRIVVNSATIGGLMSDSRDELERLYGAAEPKE
jgi:hypothetical protein